MGGLNSGWLGQELERKAALAPGSGNLRSGTPLGLKSSRNTALSKIYLMKLNPCTQRGLKAGVSRQVPNIFSKQ